MSSKLGKKIVSWIVLVSLLTTGMMANMVLADDELIDNEFSTEATIPEPADESLLSDTEQVIFPVEEREELVENEYIRDSDKPYEIVDVLPSQLEKSELRAESTDTADSANSLRTSSYDERSLYSIDMLKQNIYNPNISGGMSINAATGNASYNYNIATVLGKNCSVMNLTLEYNSNQSCFAKTCADITSAMDYYNAPTIDYDIDECLGAGWEFSNIKKKYKNYYYKLRDGRIIDTNPNSDHYYDYYYDYKDYTIDQNTITYLDGTVEYLNGLGYLQYVDDKYGNRITYTYENITDRNGQPAMRLTSISDNLNKTITINYISDNSGDYIIVTKPDNTQIRINTCNVYVEHIGTDRGFDATLPAQVLTSIYDESSNCYIASFEYTHLYFSNIFCKAGSGIMAFDKGSYMMMTACDTPFGQKHYVEYDVAEDDSSFPNIPSSQTKRWYSYVTKDYSDSAKTNLTAEYDLSVHYVSNTEDVKTYTMISPNNKVTRTISDSYSYLQELYERSNNVDVLKNRSENEFSRTNRTDKPESIINKIYNTNGNYITKQTDYTYDNYGNTLTATDTVEGTTKLETVCTYKNNAYKSLNDVTVKKGSQTFNRVYYDVNSYGDVTDEQVYDSSNTLKRRTIYLYTNNNLTQKTLYKGFLTVKLQQENYVYSGAYMVRAYTTDDSNTTIAQTEYTYDSMGRVTSTLSANHLEYISYDSLGRTTRETHADASYSEVNYDHDDEQVSVTNENGYTNTYQYNNLGKVSSVSDTIPLQTVTYDNVGNPTAVKDALNNTTNITYDAFGRQTSVLQPGNTATAKAKYYDVFLEGSNKYSVYLTISETGRIACEYYDVYGRLAKTALVKNYSSFTESSFNDIYQMPSNVQLVITSQYVYDDLDRVIAQFDGTNVGTYYTYDDLGNVTTYKYGNGTAQMQVDYTYDSAGNVTTMTQGTHVYTYEYDRAGRLTKMTDPMGYTETYTYDLAGNVKTSKDKNGTVTTNTYSSRGWLKKSVKNGKTINYTYDYTGNLLTSADENGTIEYTYNYDGTLASKKYPDNKQITYTGYNANKALTSMTDYLGNTTAYGYNSRGAVTSVAETYSGVSGTKTTQYTYNQDGSLQKVTYPLSIYMTSNYTYDYAGRVSTLTNKRTSSATYSTHNYTYNNSGNITQKAETINGTSKTTTYTYDRANRLASEKIGNSINNYSYDQYGNLTSAVGWGDIYYTYDANNRLTQVCDMYTNAQTASGVQSGIWTTDITYDNNGNMLSSSKYCGNTASNQKSYTYDTWGRLTGFSDSLGSTASYGYYSDGLRASKTIGSNTTKYYYDGDHVINETLNGSNYATNVLGVNGYISRRQNGTIGYLFKDAHGDVLAAYSSTTNKIADYSYDAWGNAKSENETSSFTNNPLRYCGEYYDTESGMTYLRARYYDSEIKRFISEDPIKDGANWYAYAGNNPVMFVDPWGLSYDEVIDALNNLYYDRGIMESYPSYTVEFQDAYSSALSAKNAIRNSDVYIEDWGGLSDTLGGIVNGDNNSLEKILNIKSMVISAKSISQNKDFWDNILSVSATSAVIAPIVKAIGGMGLSASGKIAIGTSLGNLGTLVNNPHISVNWDLITYHAKQMMMERGVTKQMVEQWMADGKVLQQASDKFIYICQQGAAVVTSAGKLITAYGSQYFDEPMRQIIDKLF